MEPNHLNPKRLELQVRFESTLDGNVGFHDLFDLLKKDIVNKL